MAYGSALLIHWYPADYDTLRLPAADNTSGRQGLRFPKNTTVVTLVYSKPRAVSSRMCPYTSADSCDELVPFPRCHAAKVHGSYHHLNQATGQLVRAWHYKLTLEVPVCHQD